MTDLSVADLLPDAYTFKRRPVAIPAHLRPLWRLGTLCLTLHHCHFKAATLAQLHVLNWAVRDETNRAAFLAAYRGHLPAGPIVRIEPSLTRAINFALGERLLARKSSTGHLMLAPRGTVLVGRIQNDDDLFAAEKAFFAEIPKKISGAMIERILDGNVVQ